jgi:hypothetical protein
MERIEVTARGKGTNQGRDGTLANHRRIHPGAQETLEPKQPPLPPTIREKLWR